MSYLVMDYTHWIPAFLQNANGCVCLLVVFSPMFNILNPLGGGDLEAMRSRCNSMRFLHWRKFSLKSGS